MDTTIHELIQFSLAPVFLLTAISAILGVLSNRLIRIVDRSREIDKLVATTPEAVDANLRLERLLLRRRSRLTNWAISLCVTSIFLVSLAIVVLFASAYVERAAGAVDRADLRLRAARADGRPRAVPARGLPRDGEPAHRVLKTTTAPGGPGAVARRVAKVDARQVFTPARFIRNDAISGSGRPVAPLSGPETDAVPAMSMCAHL